MGVAVKVTSLPRPKSFDLCRLAASSYTNLSATRILWDAKIFQYHLNEVRAFCHCLVDFQLWSRGGGGVGVKVTSLPRPKSFDLCRLAASSYTNLSVPGYCGMQKFSNTSYMRYERSAMLW